MREVQNTPEYRALHRANTLLNWKRLEYRLKHKQAMGSYRVRKLLSESSKSLWKNEKFRQRQIEVRIALWKDQNYRRKVMLIRQTQAYRSKIKKHPRRIQQSGASQANV
jgi:hypothetical protein